jgi:DNA-binding ferritin-like protein (oxidative damage protectant)
VNTAVHDHLNQLIANWNVLYVKLHHYHWYVKGSDFFTLHAKFQELYEEAALHIDELAERLLALKGRPLSRMSDFLKISHVKEAEGGESAEDMVEQLISDYTVMLRDLSGGMAAAQEAGDEITADMLLSIKSSLEKHLWMLGAFLGK